MGVAPAIRLQNRARFVLTFGQVTRAPAMVNVPSVDLHLLLVERPHVVPWLVDRFQRPHGCGSVSGNGFAALVAGFGFGTAVPSAGFCAYASHVRASD